MEQSAKWHSPQSTTGALLSAAIVHGALYGLVILILGAGLFSSAPKALEDTELTYDMLNEAPVPTQVVHQVRQAQPDKVVEKETKPDNSPKELQDDKSQVAGTQTAAKAATTNVGGDAVGDANSTPFYKVKPKYPKAALLAGTEGWILMNVDVKEDGTVDNVRVVDGDKRNLFQDEARRAVEKWKYKPFVDNSGKPYLKKDHQVRVDFKINEATM
jgi:protein TonB